MPEDTTDYAIIKIIGIGDGGCNTVYGMAPCDVQGVELIAVNSDVTRFQCSCGVTPIKLGNLNALEAADQISENIQGSDLLFLTAGMGGYTGTNVISAVARIAKKIKIPLTIALVTEPFNSEEKNRTVAAEKGISELVKHVDTLIVFPCDKLRGDVENTEDFQPCFQTINGKIGNAIQGIYEPLTRRGQIGIEFSDYRTIFTKQGFAKLGMGKSSRGLLAAEMALNNQLSKELSPHRWQNIFVNVTGGKKLSMSDIAEALEYVQNCHNDECNLIIGAPVNENLSNEIQVTVVVAGYERI